jgi:histone arginine demethylase JMJD6
MSTAISFDPCASSLTGIERRSGVSTQEFMDKYLYPWQPVVLTDAAAEWPALTRWTLDFFREQFGDRSIRVRRGQKHYKTTVGAHVNYIEACSRAGAKSSEKPRYYLRNITIGDEFPELLNDFDVPATCLPNWLERWPLKLLFPLGPKSSAELFIGPPGASVPVIHRDKNMTHSWLSQILGRKRLWLISPLQTDLMYQDPSDPDHSMVNSPNDPDLEHFPAFARAQVASCVLEPGDTIFLPAGWWHAVECTTASISISGNFANGSNFGAFRDMTVLPAFRGGRAKALLNRTLLDCHRVICGLEDTLKSPSRLSPGVKRLAAKQASSGLRRYWNGQSQNRPD